MAKEVPSAEWARAKEFGGLASTNSTTSQLTLTQLVCREVAAVAPQTHDRLECAAPLAGSLEMVDGWNLALMATGGLVALLGCYDVLLGRLGRAPEAVEVQGNDRRVARGKGDGRLKVKFLLVSRACES